MSRLLLVRHGDTEANSAERYWGHTDVKLSAAGLRQAKLLQQRLANEKIDAIYASDLDRAMVTAQTIAAGHHRQVMTCAELREINFGEVEGLTFAEVGKLYPEVAELWRQRSFKLRYPRGESVEELNNRVSQFRCRLETHGAAETVLIVAHSASLRLLMCHLMGLAPQHWWQFRLDLASLTVLTTYPGGAILNVLNDVCHLGGANVS